MGKRFTDTDKWRKEWFQDLPPRLKCFWQFLCDNCDAAGVWDQNYRLASFQVGETVTADDLAAFGDRVEIIESGKLWLTTFIAFQYGSLSESCKAHIPVFKSLEKNGLSQRVSKGYPKGIHTLKEKDMYMEKEKDKEKEKEKDKEKDANRQAKPPEVASVIDHYRTLHPKAKPNGKTTKLIKSRLDDGYTVDELCQAIDGCHKSPYHCGENESGTVYQSLDLIFRDSDKVQRFIELNENPPKAKASFKVSDLIPVGRGQRFEGDEVF